MFPSGKSPAWVEFVVKTWGGHKADRRLSPNTRKNRLPQRFGLSTAIDSAYTKSEDRKRKTPKKQAFEGFSKRIIDEKSDDSRTCMTVCLQANRQQTKESYRSVVPWQKAVFEQK
jgi:hypothetical protein